MSESLDLRNDRVSDRDALRQQETAAEILRRLDDQPGVILADEVGMGKTYVALAVAVSVLEATRRRHPIVVMVPASVAEKWPREWSVFAERCLAPGHGLRASGAVRRGSDFLRLLDDPSATRKHLIFLTHGALTSNLNDPFIRLALMRRALLRRRDTETTRRAVARAAGRLLNDRRFNEAVATDLLASPFSAWRALWNAHRPRDPQSDDPVPYVLEAALRQVDLNPLYETLRALPVRRNARYDQRLLGARRELNGILQDTWTQSLRALDVRLPLLILDEAHHTKNPNQLSRLLDNPEAEEDMEAFQGPLGKMFQRMLFLTATPFQLGHHELLQVLDRFHGIRWTSGAERRAFDAQLGALRQALDSAQGSALRLERAWARIDPLDAQELAAVQDFAPADDQPEALRNALALASSAEADKDAAEMHLRPWVIRHTKPDKARRRAYLPGRAILDDQPSALGLSVDGAATLPFLLAARAQALASLNQTGMGQATRAYYAYGLASSFEAYADTRRNRIAAIDDQDAPTPTVTVSPQLRWYLDKIADALPTDNVEEWATHPKIAATVARSLVLWRRGEKVLIFCFYVETGRALRAHISRAVAGEIAQRASTALNLDPSDHDKVFAELGRIGARLLRADSPGYREFQARIRTLTEGLESEVEDSVVEIATRFMRTSSFLVRFVDLSPRVSTDELLAGIDRADGSGLTLADRIRSLTESLKTQVAVEQEEMLDVLKDIPTGTIATTVDYFDPSERTSSREMLLPNVRLANGGVRADTRRRLMLAFNAPFFPEILIASSVMAEGVDLHQACRYVIHHDLDWNPSTLEQRTGRVDRIRSKGERSRQPVVVYEPFLGGTHDEKMFRVVKDRERWFGIVMGDKPTADERSTEEEEGRVALPTWIASRLTMDLSCCDLAAEHAT